MFLVCHPPEFFSSKGAVAVNLTAEGVTDLSGYIIITAMVCVTVESTVCIFAILAYLKEKAILKYKNSFKDIVDNELSIDVESDKNKNSKK